MNNYYFVQQILFNSTIENLIEPNIEIIYHSKSLMEANNYILNMGKIQIKSKRYNINDILKKTPTDEDMDGFYLVNAQDDDDLKDTFYIYQKISKISRGYMFNSTDVQIEKLGFLKIINYALNKDDNNDNTITMSINQTTSYRDVEVDSNIQYQLIQELKNKLEEINLKKNN